MPYIKQEDRNKFKATWDAVCVNPPSTPGELNYILTLIALEYLAIKGEKYQYYNDIIGALEGCKLEFYRRCVSIYEDEAIKKNGDV